MDVGGPKFWLAYIGGAIAFAFAGFMLFILIDAAVYRWGFFGMFLFFSAVLLGIAWVFDRRTKRQYDDALGDAQQ